MTCSLAALALLADADAKKPPPDAGPDRGSAAGAPADDRLHLVPVAIPADAATRKTPLVATEAWLGGKKIPVGFHPVSRAMVGSYGTVTAKGGGRTVLQCPEQDYTSVLAGPQGHVLLNHFECSPGAVWLSPISFDAAGLPTVGAGKETNWDAWGGLWTPCAGSISPWGTHLGSEEYEPDAASLLPDGSLANDGYGAWRDMRAWSDQPLRVFDYGWTTEVTAEGATRKHYALGRLSHELAVALPDRRTVYETDDGSATGLYLFVADTAGDLSAGNLYAAEFLTIGEELSTRWMPLGHATHDEIAKAIDAGVAFGDLFEGAAPTGKTCPADFRYVNTAMGEECLKLRAPSEKFPDPARLASRLETRRYAAYLGATTELEKTEGLVYDPVGQTVFLAATAIQNRMLAEPGAPVDGIAWPENRCGAVLQGKVGPGMTDQLGQPIPSELVFTSLAPIVRGRPIDVVDGNGCAVDAIANPDNLAFLPGHGLLTIAEDTKWGKGHANAALWVFELATLELKRVMVVPRGAEVTGITWLPDVAGHGYLTATIQHPFAELPKGAPPPPPGLTDDDLRATSALIGPFPKLGP